MRFSNSKEPHLTKWDSLISSDLISNALKENYKKLTQNPAHIIF